MINISDKLSHKKIVALLAISALTGCTRGYSTSVVYWPGHVDAKATVYVGCERSDRCADTISMAEVLAKVASEKISAKPKQIRVNGTN